MDEEIDLRQLLAVFWNRRAIVAAVVALVLAAAAVQVFLARASERVIEKRSVIQTRLRAASAQQAEVERLMGFARRVLEGLRGGGGLADRDRGLIRAFTLNSLSVAESLRHGLSGTERALRTELVDLEPPAVVQHPSRPADPASPRTTLSLIPAGTLGLMVGTILAFIWDALAAPPGAGQPAAAGMRPGGLSEGSGPRG
ncbi:MAG TPA: hypothetical protein VNN19_12940 [bacterium]|nr:hypothetical protein [bacterium]